MKIVKSQVKGKKYTAIFEDGTKTSFGAEGMSDYTIHKDKKRRDNYRARHKKDLDTNDPKRAGYLSYYLLWGDSTDLQTNIKNYISKFKV
jgi:hypothetical protein